MQFHRETELMFCNRLATLAQNIVLIGQAAGCHAVVNLLNERSKLRRASPAIRKLNLIVLGVSCMARVRAAVQIFDLQRPPIIAANDRVPGLRKWFYELSMAIFPAEHQVLEEQDRVGKRYGNGTIATPIGLHRADKSAQCTYRRIRDPRTS